MTSQKGTDKQDWYAAPSAKLQREPAWCGTYGMSFYSEAVPHQGSLDRRIVRRQSLNELFFCLKNIHFGLISACSYLSSHKVHERAINGALTCPTDLSDTWGATMRCFRLLHVSDLHLSEVRAYNVRNWEICLQEIDARRPDLVVVGGDMTLDDPDAEGDQRFARSQLDRRPVPWKALPGNHDVGDNPPFPYRDQPITQQRLDRYRALYGPDYWCIDCDDWRIVGINSQLFASGLSPEREQYEWLAQVLGNANGRQVAIFTHKPLCLDAIEETTTSQWHVDPESRQKLWRLLRQYNVRLVASGHTHRYRTMSADGISMVWCLTTAQINRGMKSPRNGLPDQHAGFVWFQFRSNAVEWNLVRPLALVAFDATELSAKYGAMRNTPEYRLEPLVNA